MTGKTEIKHAYLSASGSAMWLGCSGAPRANAAYPDTSSEFAEEGRHAHALADLCMKNERDADFYGGMKVEGKLVPRDMIEHVQEYLNYVRSFETTETQLYTEEQVDFSNVVPGGFGTMDSAVLAYNTGLCHIFDLKYGKGIEVIAKNNSQGRLYALGLLNELEWQGTITGFRIHIVQPRKGGSSFEDLTIGELKEWGDYVKERALLALEPDAPRTAGEKQCLWCKAKGDCPTLFEFAQEMISAEFDDMGEGLEIENLTDGQKARILANQSLVIAFMDAVRVSVVKRIEDGQGFPGYKLVEGRSNRTWIEGSEEWLENLLGDHAWSKKFIGIGDAEKRLGRKRVAKWLEKKSGKATLALESDTRPTAGASADVADDFADITSVPQ